jgi:hypothetical protein
MTTSTDYLPSVANDGSAITRYHLVNINTCSGYDEKDSASDGADNL